MNFLAHLLLTPQTTGGYVGALLPDLVRGRERQRWRRTTQAILTAPAANGPHAAPIRTAQQTVREVVEAAALHREIDRFTDAHPVFARSCVRVPPPHRRYAGILTDLFYDHCLALRWDRYDARPLARFIDQAYVKLRSASPIMPAMMADAVDHLTGEDWLARYATVDGIRLTLTRMSARIGAAYGRDLGLAPAADVLAERRADFLGDFDDFFPQLRAHADAWPARTHDADTDH